MIFSFSGASGSGKSTIITQIQSYPLFKDKKVVVRKEDSFFTIQLLKYLLGDSIFSQYKDDKYFRKSYSGVSYKFFSILTYLIYPLVVYIEFLIEFIKYEILFKNDILIIDKFIYDHAVNFRNVLGINNEFIEWLYNHFPKPYLSFLIDINLANASIKRNKNNIPGKVTANVQLHKNILTHYAEIAKRNNVIVIDNNGYLKDAVEKIYTHVINKKKLLNAKRIAICGLDGSGKTTTVNMLAKYVETLGIDYKIVHFVHNNLLYKVLLALGYYDMKQPKSVLYKRSRAHSARERINKTSFVMVFLRFFDSYAQYLYYVLTNRNKLIIFDRFFYDYLVSFGYLDIRGRSFFNQFVPFIKNKFLFSVSPEVSYKRKPERVKAFFIECHQLYLKVAKEYNINIINVDNKNPDQVLQELMGKIK